MASCELSSVWKGTWESNEPLLELIPSFSGQLLPLHVSVLALSILEPATGTVAADLSLSKAEHGELLKKLPIGNASMCLIVLSSMMIIG